jgi:hypothetical protein
MDSELSKEPSWPIIWGAILPAIGIVQGLFVMGLFSLVPMFGAFLCTAVIFGVIGYFLSLAVDTLIFAYFTKRGLKRAATIALSMSLWRMSGSQVSGFIGHCCLSAFLTFAAGPLGIFGPQFRAGVSSFLGGVLTLIIMTIAFLTGLFVVEQIHKVKLSKQLLTALIVSEIGVSVITVGVIMLLTFCFHLHLSS